MSNQLFFLSLADIFSVYPAIFKEQSKKLKKMKQIYLPSDEEWQDKMYVLDYPYYLSSNGSKKWYFKRYYMLLEIQRQVNDSSDDTVSLQDMNKRRNPCSIP